MGTDIWVAVARPPPLAPSKLVSILSLLLLYRVGECGVAQTLVDSRSVTSLSKVLLVHTSLRYSGIKERSCHITIESHFTTQTFPGGGDKLDLPALRNRPPLLRGCQTPDPPSSQ